MKTRTKGHWWVQPDNYRNVVVNQHMEFMSSSRSHNLFGTCSPAVVTLTRSPGKVGEGVLLGLIFAGYVPLASQGPYPIIVYSVVNYRPLLNRFWAKTYFSRSQLSHFLICIYLILNREHLTFHLQYKHSGMFAKRKSWTVLPQKSANVQPHSTNAIENVTPL